MKKERIRSCWGYSCRFDRPSKVRFRLDFHDDNRILADYYCDRKKYRKCVRSGVDCKYNELKPEEIRRRYFSDVDIGDFVLMIE